MEFPSLETDRLTLRQITETDASSLFEYLSQDEVTKYYGNDTFQTMDEAQNLIVRFQEIFRTESGIRWAIIEKKRASLIGTIGFHLWNKKNQRAEIGYDINPRYWRKGYAIEALSCVLAHGFMNMNLHRVGAIVFPENIASIQLLKKAGFTEEGLLRDNIFQNDSFHHTKIFSLLRNDWVLE